MTDPANDEPATNPLAPLEARARALRAQKDAAHRNTVLHEAAAAIQDFIDRDRARSAARSNDRAALGAARQIVLGLIDGPEATIPTPAPVDRAAVLREAADDLATAFGDPMAKHIGITAASYLRRRAREADAASGPIRAAGQTQQDAADPTWPRRAWDLGLLHTGGDPHHCSACLAQPEPPAGFVCPGTEANAAVLAHPQPLSEPSEEA